MKPDIGLEEVFFVAAGLVQFALAALLWRRAGPRHALRVLAALFAANGVVTLFNRAAANNVWAVSGDLEVWQFIAQTLWRIADPIEALTGFLIVYLVLVYPQPIALVRRHPRLVLRSLIAVAVVWTAVFAIHPSWLHWNAAWPWSHAQKHASALFLQAVPGILAWFAVLTRWPRLVAEVHDPVARREFTIILAALAMRAAHIIIGAGLDAVYLAYQDEGATADASRELARSAAFTALIPITALLVAVVRLSIIQVRNPSRRPEARFVMAFLAAGVTQAFFFGGISPLDTGWGSLFSHYDVYVLRPVMVYAAVFGPTYSTRIFERRLTLPAFLAAFGALGSFVALQPLVESSFESKVAGYMFASLAAVAASVLVAALLSPSLLRSPLARNVADPERARAVEEYIRQLEMGIEMGPTRLPEPHRKALQEMQHLGWANTVTQGPWLPGEVLVGRYRVRASLGEGGSGDVYLAEDALGGGLVVLKRTRKLGEPEVRALLHEAAALERLGHPNIVRLLGVERVEGGPVLVLEYMEGGSLQAVLDAGRPISSHRAQKIASDVLEALVASHAEGVVHRDIKASNILLDRRGRAKLADFGIARDVEVLPGATVTAASQPGSLRSMAPEQILGRPATVRSDLYSLGIVLLTAVTGVHPVPQGLDDLATRRAVVEGPSARLPKRVGEPLRSLLAALCEKDPAKRPASAAAALAILGRKARAVRG